MRKIAEKIAFVAFVCISVFFAVLATMYVTVGMPDEGWNNGGINIALIIVADIVLAGLAAYLLYEKFSSHVALKRLLLYCDSESTTSANKKVVSNVVNGCAKHVDGVKVRKTKITADDKQGFVLTLHIVAYGVAVQKNLDKLRCLLTTAFEETLGVRFNGINFVVDKLSSRYSPDLPTADKQAEMLADGRRQADDFYDDPLGKYNEEQAGDGEEKTGDKEQAEGEALQTQNDNHEYADNDVLSE